MNDLIAAQATPAGSSALAVIRLSGDGAISLIEKLMQLDEGRLAGMRRSVGAIFRGDTELDTLVAISWPDGRSYTSLAKTGSRSRPSSDVRTETGWKKSAPSELRQTVALPLPATIRRVWASMSR